MLRPPNIIADVQSAGKRHNVLGVVTSRAMLRMKHVPATNLPCPEIDALKMRMPITIKKAVKASRLGAGAACWLSGLEFALNI